MYVRFAARYCGNPSPVTMSLLLVVLRTLCAMLRLVIAATQHVASPSEFIFERNSALCLERSK